MNVIEFFISRTVPAGMPSCCPVEKLARTPPLTLTSPITPTPNTPSPLSPPTMLQHFNTTAHLLPRQLQVKACSGGSDPNPKFTPHQTWMKFLEVMGML